MIKALKTVGRYIMLMGRTFARPERMRMFFRQYINEMGQLGVNSIGIVLLISFFIGAVITIQIKLNIESPFMPRWTVGYVTREIMLLEFSSSIMCLISGKSRFQYRFRAGNHASDTTDRRTGDHGSQFSQLPDTTQNFCHGHHYPFPGDVQYLCRYHRSLCHMLVRWHHVGGGPGIRFTIHEWFIWCGIIKSLFFAFIIASVSAFFGYTVEGGSIEVGKASTDSVVCSSVLILFADLILTKLLMG